MRLLEASAHVTTPLRLPNSKEAALLLLRGMRQWGITLPDGTPRLFGRHLLRHIGPPTRSRRKSCSEQGDCVALDLPDSPRATMAGWARFATDEDAQRSDRPSMPPTPGGV